MTVDAGEAPGKSDAGRRQGGEVEVAVIRPPDDLDGRFAARRFRVADFVDGAVEAADPLEPPVNVHASVATGQAGVAADSDYHVAAGVVELVGELYAGGR